MTEKNQPKSIEELKQLYPEELHKRQMFSKTFHKGCGSYSIVATMHPLHYEDKDHNFQEIDCCIEDGRVEKTVYTATLLTDKIGYSIVADEDGSRIDVKLNTIGGNSIPYYSPTIEDNKAIWHDITTDVDFIIEFAPTKVRCWKRLKSAQAAKDITFTVIEDDKKKLLRVINRIVGYDADGKPTKQKIDKGEENIYKTVETEVDVKEYTWKQTFEDKIIVRDEETRVKKFSDVVVYPVMIDADVNITISNSANDGIDSKTGDSSDEFATDNNYNRNIRYFGDYNSAWQRFDGITIPQGAIINNATLTLYMVANNIDTTGTQTKTTLNALALNESDPDVTALHDIVDATDVLSTGDGFENITIQSVTISSGSTYKNNFAEEQANVQSIVQSLVNSYNYSSDAMVFFGRKNIITDDQSPADTSTYKGIFIYDRTWGESKAPQLEINFTAPRTYTKGTEDTLQSSTNNNLTEFSEAEYDAVGTTDGNRAEQPGYANYSVFMFKDTHASVEPIRVNCVGQSDRATSASTVYLEIFNVTDTQWEELSSDSTTAANTNFTLTGWQSADIAKYYDGLVVTCRVRQLAE